MDTCKHLDWIRVTDNHGPEKIAFETTSRLRTLVQEMPDPALQTPQLAFFLGGATKNEALKHIFSRNNISRRGGKGNVDLRMDTESVNSDHPLLFADGNPLEKKLPDHGHVWCHEMKAHSADWHIDPPQLETDFVYSRLIFLFSDVIYVFIDDFPTLEAVMMRLIAWAEIGSASPLAIDVHPRLVFIISEDGPFRDTRIDEFQKAMATGLGVQMRSTFSSFRIFRLAGKHLSTLVRYQRLRGELRQQLEDMRAVRSLSRCLFSALHLCAFFEAAVQHTVDAPSEKFDFIAVSRAANPVVKEPTYLQLFLELASRAKISHDVISGFVASSILMDAFPSRMHREFFRPTSGDY
jgi:hypothetical protein